MTFNVTALSVLSLTSSNVIQTFGDRSNSDNPSVTNVMTQPEFEFPVLDPRNQDSLADGAIQLALASGLVRDIYPNDPLDVMIRSQAYVGSELLFRLNQLPKALLAEFLKLTAVAAPTPTRARHKQRFRITRSIPGYRIPEGFEIRTPAGQRFVLEESVVFEPAATEAEGVVVAVEPGSDYNVPVGTIRLPVVSQSFLARTENIELLSPGVAGEAPQETLARQLQRLQIRALVTERDYEHYAEGMLGPGSEARAYGLVGPDGQTRQLGSVHLFLLASDKRPARLDQVNLVRSQLTPQIQAGTDLYVSPMRVTPVTVEAALDVGSNLDLLNQAWSALQVFSDTSLKCGVPVTGDEVFFALRSTPGIQAVEGVTLNSNQYALNPTQNGERFVIDSARFWVNGVEYNFGTGDPD